MSVSAPAPQIAATEEKIEAAVPAIVQPVVQSVEDQFNTLLTEAGAAAPAEGEKAAEADPAVAKIAGDVVAHNLDAAQDFTDLKAGYQEAKAGYKTTEFWGSLVLIVLTQVGALDLPGNGKTITTAATGAAYAISRGLAKLGVASPR